MGVRLVVSGQDSRGKSVIASDSIVERIDMGATVVPLWSSDQVPTFPIDGKRPPFPSSFPTAGGYRFLLLTLPPGDLHPSDADLKGPAEAWSDVMERNSRGMHTTDTVDLEIVLSGEASMELDDGIVVHLKAGDCFVQNGTRHRWFNRGKTEAVLAVIVIGGEPRQ
jgi:mannose-6-phosphate isomerase-like protein (cupin superfamily)